MKHNALKNYKKSLVALCLVLSIFCFANTAKASVVSDLSAGITSFVRFFNQTVILGIRNNICNIYISKPSSDFIARLLSGLCAHYKPAEIEKVSFDFGKLFTPIQSILKDFTPKSFTPGGLFGNTTTAGNILNNGQIIYWTNIERGDNGPLPPLTENSVLDKIAEIRVQDMFNKGYFAHISPTGDSVSKEAVANGYKYITIGENIALGNFGSSRELVIAWMNSPGHRANILNNNYKEIGVSAIEGMYQGSKVWIAAQIFGRKLSDCPEPDASLKTKIDSEKATADSLNTELKNIQTQLQTMDNSNTSAYNTKVSEYNSLAKTYNNLIADIKNLIAEYNTQVDAFNTCLKTP